MKKRVLPLIYTYVVFFILCSFVVTVSFLLFFHSIHLETEDIKKAAPITFLNVMFMTALFALFDNIRRHLTIEKDISNINEALAKITSGDFTVRLDSEHTDPAFSGIMANINAMTEELNGLETLRSDFVANVSHEMKTPLSVIGNYGTLLQAEQLSYGDRVEYAKAITASSRRLSELITNILKLNRLENQKIYPETIKYNLSEQLCECLLQYENVWESKNIEIDTNIDEEVYVDSDKELLLLVWSNLFSNAFKFTDDGGKVTVSLTKDNTHTIVSVTDSGCGMTAETGKHIFEKFYQGDTSHATAGNGLGLALVKRIIDIVNGEISVSSTLSVGSTFTVKIPL